MQSHEPVKVRGWRKSIPEKEYISEEVKKLEENGKIRKSQSPWAAQVVLVSKKDGTRQFCIDFMSFMISRGKKPGKLRV